MPKIKSLADLQKLKEEVRSKISIREKGDHPENLVRIKVAMATCGIAAGAREIMNYFTEELDHQGIEALVTQTGCMGFCYAEPTIELTLPGKEPVIYGYVNTTKAREIIEKHIKLGEFTDGIIPVNFSTIDE